MDTRFLPAILGVFSTFALGACTVITSTGTGGTGGAASASSTGGVDTSASSTSGAGGAGGDATTTTTTATSTSTGTAMCDPAYTCADAIAEGTGDPAELCDGPARKSFDALAACTCTGACATACGDNACAQQDPSTECKTCLVTVDKGCKAEFDACVNG